MVVLPAQPPRRIHRGVTDIGGVPAGGDLVVSQTVERPGVVVVSVVLDAGVQEKVVFVDPVLRPQVVELALADDPIKVACEPIRVAVAELVLTNASSGSSKPDPGIGDDAKLPLAAPHRIEEVGIPGARAAHALAGTGHHLQFLDLPDLRPVPVRGGP